MLCYILFTLCASPEVSEGREGVFYSNLWNMIYWDCVSFFMCIEVCNIIISVLTTCKLTLSSMSLTLQKKKPLAWEFSLSQCYVWWLLHATKIHMHGHFIPRNVVQTLTLFFYIITEMYKAMHIAYKAVQRVIFERQMFLTLFVSCWLPTFLGASLWLQGKRDAYNHGETWKPFQYLSQ